MLLRSIDEVTEVLSRSLACNGLQLHERELAPEFFDLRTRIAGELFQKLVNYGARLAIVVENPQRYGERFSELIFEHRKHPSIRFFSCQEDATHWLTETG